VTLHIAVNQPPVSAAISLYGTLEGSGLKGKGTVIWWRAGHSDVQQDNETFCLSEYCSYSRRPI